MNARTITAQSVAGGRDYKSDGDEITSWKALPFVHRSKRGPKKSSNWSVPPTDDFALASDIGREYAAHFALFLKENAGVVGAGQLGQIAAAINFEDETGAKGYWVGFFAHLERLIFAQAQHMDVFADVDQIRAHYAGALRSTLEVIE